MPAVASLPLTIPTTNTKSRSGAINPTVTFNMQRNRSQDLTIRRSRDAFIAMAREVGAEEPSPFRLFLPGGADGCNEAQLGLQLPPKI
jgi:hypothetical protein